MREAFLTRVESSIARRIEGHAEAFGSNSAFIRLALRVFFRLMDAGIISLDLVWLQGLLQENPENLRNRVAIAAREPVSATEALRGLTPPAQRKSATHRMEARATAFRISPIPPSDFAISKIAIGCGARA